MTLLIRNTLVLLTLIFVGVLIFRKNQDKKLNWSLFYSSLYTTVSLALTNYFCVDFGLWTFNKESSNVLNIPFDFYFIWIVFWGILPVYLFKGKHIILITVSLIWIDVLFMSELGKTELLHLSNYWMIGEVLLISFVFIPSYLWAKFSYNKKHTGVRAIFQVAIMIVLFIVGLPFILSVYGLIEPLNYRWSII